MSKKDQWYRQVRYTRKTKDGRKIGVGWILEETAKVGKRFYIKDEGNEDEIWTVVEVWGRQRYGWLREHQNDYRHQREMSDV